MDRGNVSPPAGGIRPGRPPERATTETGAESPAYGPLALCLSGGSLPDKGAEDGAAGAAGRSANRRTSVWPAAAADRSPGLGGAFIVAEGRDGIRAAHADNQLSAQITDRPEEIATLMRRWDRIMGVALPVGQSLNLIKEAAES